MVHVIGVNWSMLGEGGQKSPKNGPHGLRMPPNGHPGPFIMLNIALKGKKILVLGCF